MRKSAKQKIEEYLLRKAEDRREQDRIKHSKDFRPEHPDNK